MIKDRPVISREYIEGVRRERIFRGMADSFFKHGWDGTTVSTIVKEASCARKSFYDVFDGKVDAFRAMMLEAGERIKDAASSASDLVDCINDNERMMSAFLIYGPKEGELYQGILDEVTMLIAGCYEKGTEPRIGTKARMVVGGVEYIVRKSFIEQSDVGQLLPEIENFLSVTKGTSV